MNKIHSERTGEISLKILILQLLSLWRYLTARWPVILIAGIIGAAAGLIYALNKKPLYKAELTFALDDEQPELGGALGLASQFGFNFGDTRSGIFAGNNLLELMRSRYMIKKTLLTPVNIKGRKESLADLYIDYRGLREQWKDPELKNIRFPPGTDPRKLTLTQDSLLRVFHRSLLEDNLQVEKKDKQLNIISVDVTSENELFAKYFTEVLVKDVSDFYVATRTKKTAQNLAILQHQTDSVRRALNAAISGMAVSSGAYPNPNIALKELNIPSDQKRVDVQINTAMLSELVKNLEIAKVALRKETPLIQIIDTPDLPLEKAGVSKIKWMLAGGLLAAFFTVLFFSAGLFYMQLMNE